MSYFLSDRPLSPGQTLSLHGDEARHLLGSRRMRAGDRFALQDPDGRRFEAALVSTERRGLVVEVLEPIAAPLPPAVRITLLQAAVKDKAAGLIVQKATEMGVAAVCFFPSEHSTLSHKVLSQASGVARWERIAWEACKQCDRAAPPSLRVARDLAEVLRPAEGQGAGLVLHPQGALALGKALDAENGAGQAHLRLLVGPEGGFSHAEMEQALAAGFRPARLGGTILRAETAALAACAVALYGWK